MHTSQVLVGSLQSTVDEVEELAGECLDQHTLGAIGSALLKVLGRSATRIANRAKRQTGPDADAESQQMMVRSHHRNFDPRIHSRPHGHSFDPYCTHSFHLDRLPPRLFRLQEAQNATEDQLNILISECVASLMKVGASPALPSPPCPPLPPLPSASAFAPRVCWSIIVTQAQTELPNHKY